MTNLPPINKPDRSYVPWYRRCVPSWRTVAIVVVLVLAAPFAVRWCRLSRMPDVPVPFDVETFCEPLTPKEENAFDYFEQTVYLSAPYVTDQTFLKYINAVADKLPRDEVAVWSDAPDNVGEWVRRNQPAVQLLRRGGRCSSASYIDPLNYRVSTPLPVLESVRMLFNVIRLNVVRQLDGGDTQEVAELLHDAYRASRHLGRRGTMVERLTGVGCHGTAADCWRAWSRHPQVTAEAIETALARLREDWKLTPPQSDNFKTDCLMLLNEVKMPMLFLRGEFQVQTAYDWENRTRQPVTPKFAWLNARVPGWEIPIMWILAEPELSNRAAKLWATQELKTCDLPFSEQPPRLDGKLRLHATSDLTTGLTAAELNRRLEAAVVSQVVMGGDHFQGLIRGEAARQALLETSLLWQIEIRKKQLQTRAEVERLIDEFSWAIDPCSADGKPIQFRAAERGLVVWSLGQDGVDQGGVYPEGDATPMDVVITIPWPTETP